MSPYLLLPTLLALSLHFSAKPIAPTLIEHAIAGPLRDSPSLFFVVRDLHSDWWHPTPRDTDEPASPPKAVPTAHPHADTTSPASHASLCRLNILTGLRDELLRISPGDIRGCQLSPDGQQLVLSIRSGPPNTPFHLATLCLDPNGTGNLIGPLQWITDGPSDDLDPEFLPDGSLVFSSSRDPGQPGPRVLRLFQCAADGSNTRPFSTRRETQREPRSLPSGHVLFSQPRASDPSLPPSTQLIGARPGAPTQHVAAGRGPMQALTFFQARPVPGNQKLLAVATPSAALTRESGWLALIDPTLGAHQPQSVQLLFLEPGRLQYVLERATMGPPDPQPLRIEHPELGWRYPYPISETLFLALKDNEIWLGNTQGNATLLYKETELEGELAYIQPVTVHSRPYRPDRP